MTDFDKQLNHVLSDDYISRHSNFELGKAVKQAVDKYVIGENVKPHMGGREIHAGEAVTIDFENNMKESAIFIEDNAIYGFQQKQRQSLWGEKQ